MELRENPEFSGPEKSYREIAAAVLNALVEPTHGRVSMVFLITEKQHYMKLGFESFPFLKWGQKTPISGPTVKSYSKEN